MEQANQIQTTSQTQPSNFGATAQKLLQSDNKKGSKKDGPKSPVA
jgi:hypothetical protein